MTQTNITDKVTRVAIVANGKYQSRRVASKLFTTFKEDKRFYLSKKDPDIVISIGGDGMLLSAFHMYEKILIKRALSESIQDTLVSIRIIVILKLKN